MTVLDASNLLWAWFSKNDNFCEDNFKNVVLISENQDSEWAAILAALQEFEKLNLVIRSKIDREGVKRGQPPIKDVWVLRKNFAQFEQTVVISATTALQLADLINLIGNTYSDELWRADATQIKEIDIYKLIELCSSLIKKQTP